MCALATALLLAAGAEGGEEYPTFGICTGENVRLRQAPDTSTDSNITGRLNDLDRFVIVGETAVDGAVWYEIEHPEKKGTAWVFGKYVDTYKGDALGTPAFAMHVRVAQSFGLTPARARVIFGAPKGKKRG
ncbi:SH3 domain-containing protein, partial [Fretibacterium fastidiosum]|uniref:SH3 domain-containing protein n=1 Tax=Fretibacterium fastidiosum TaxID=651822 RepID=UPI001AD84F95